MQLKQRIKKFEEKLNLNNTGSEFCDCYEKHWESSLESVYNKNPDIEIEIYPMPNFEKGFCDKCNKSFSSKNIEMSKNVEKIYGDNNEHFKPIKKN